MQSMSNLDRLPIGDHEFDTDIVSVFAEEACELLDSHHRIFTYYNFETDTATQIVATDRFDFELDDGRTLTLRLRMMEQVNADIDAMVFGGAVDVLPIVNRPSMGLVLEHAYFSAEESETLDCVSDSQIPWIPYVFVGIYEEDIAVKSALLDARTGIDLTLEDQLKALQALRALRSNVAALSMINVVLENDSSPHESIEFSSIEPRFDDAQQGSEVFRPGEYIASYECDVCGNSFIYCEHNQHRLN